MREGTDSESREEPYPLRGAPPAGEPDTDKAEYKNVVYDSPNPNSNRGAMLAYGDRKVRMIVATSLLGQLTASKCL